MEYLKIAEEFGKISWPYKNKLKLEDIMLFGSVAYGKKDPSDLDLLVLHQNKILEDFQDSANLKIDDTDKLIDLSHRLNEKIDLLNIIHGTIIENLIFKNKFNVKYMDIKFFKYLNYREKWLKRDREAYGTITHPTWLPGETFVECIFRQGRLYNPKTQRYDIPAKQKYQISN